MLATPDVIESLVAPVGPSLPLGGLLASYRRIRKGKQVARARPRPRPR